MRGLGSDRGVHSLEAEELRTRNKRGNKRFLLGHREIASL